jgi:dihydrofolate reductase
MKTILIMAITLDGKIGRDPTHFVDWTGKEDKKIFVKLTRDAGVIIMGSTTFDTIGRILPGRKNIVITRNKNRVSNDKDLLFTDNEPLLILEDLESEGFKTVAMIGGSQINSLFLKAKLIDEIYVTIVPKLFGKGLSMFNEGTDIDLELISWQEVDKGHLLLRYKAIY